MTEEVEADDSDGWIVFATGQIVCPVCKTPIPVLVLARFEIDEDGNQVLNTNADASEAWAHVWSHEGQPS